MKPKVETREKRRRRKFSRSPHASPTLLFIWSRQSLFTLKALSHFHYKAKAMLLTSRLTIPLLIYSSLSLSFVELYTPLSSLIPNYLSSLRGQHPPRVCSMPCPFLASFIKNRTSFSIVMTYTITSIGSDDTWSTSYRSMLFIHFTLSSSVSPTPSAFFSRNPNATCKFALLSISWETFVVTIFASISNVCEREVFV